MLLRCTGWKTGNPATRNKELRDIAGSADPAVNNCKRTFVRWSILWGAAENPKTAGLPKRFNHETGVDQRTSIDLLRRLA
jgi:hypothetical protein